MTVVLVAAPRWYGDDMMNVLQAIDQREDLVMMTTEVSNTYII